jgi:hypothetical protein
MQPRKEVKSTELRISLEEEKGNQLRPSYGGPGLYMILSCLAAVIFM